MSEQAGQWAGRHGNEVSGSCRTFHTNAMTRASASGNRASACGTRRPIDEAQERSDGHRHRAFAVHPSLARSSGDQCAFSDGGTYICADSNLTIPCCADGLFRCLCGPAAEPLTFGHCCIASRCSTAGVHILTARLHRADREHEPLGASHDDRAVRRDRDRRVQREAGRHIPGTTSTRSTRGRGRRC